MYCKGYDNFMAEHRRYIERAERRAETEAENPAHDADMDVEAERKALREYYEASVYPQELFEPN